MRARELMSTPVITTYPEAPVKEVAELMAAHGISGLPVVDRVGRLVGMVSESDFLKSMEYTKIGRGMPGWLDRVARLLGADHRYQARTAADLMSARLIAAGPDAPVRELVHLMTVYDVNRIPIVEDGRVVGIVARADILKTLARHDTAITEEVLWRLRHELWIDTKGLEITTREGVVKVAGEVETQSDAVLLERWAAATEGVVGVDTRDLRYRLDDRRVKVATERLR